MMICITSVKVAISGQIFSKCFTDTYMQCACNNHDNRDIYNRDTHF